MTLHRSPVPAAHPRFSRRTAIQAGAIGLLGLGGNHLRALQAAGGQASSQRRHKSVIYLFLSLESRSSFPPANNPGSGARR